jgi:hypothetical protein
MQTVELITRINYSYRPFRPAIDIAKHSGLDLGLGLLSMLT